MKKRVVAVLLSLSMCMATAAEATAVSAAEFSAEIAVTEDNEEPVTDEEADSNEETDDPAVTIDEAGSEDGEVFLNRNPQKNLKMQIWILSLMRILLLKQM